MASLSQVHISHNFAVLHQGPEQNDTQAGRPSSLGVIEGKDTW